MYFLPFTKIAKDRTSDCFAMIDKNNANLGHLALIKFAKELLNAVRFQK
jgi:hypothetical protein